MITSDDVFEAMLNTRKQNQRKRTRAAEAYPEWCIAQGSSSGIRYLNFETGENVDEFLDFQKKKHKYFGDYLAEVVGLQEVSYSNGETALLYLSEKIQNEGLYLLDEPENSMSCEFQTRLKELIELKAYRADAQFMIATHSPFLLSIPNAKIYNMDTTPVSIDKWWNLPNMRLYYQLFHECAAQFENRML